MKEKEVEAGKALDAQIRKQAEAEKYAQQQRSDAQLYARRKKLKRANLKSSRKRKPRKPRLTRSGIRRNVKHRGIQMVGKRKPKLLGPKALPAEG
ncbi:MAG: hypothetical protein ACLVJ6_12015 [Merdibacter sp.]